MSTTRWRQDPLADNHFKFTEEGVEIRKYISSKKFRKLEWNKLTNIIVWGKYGGLGIIDNNGKLLWGFVYKHGFFNSRKKIEPIWQKWLRGIRNKDKINTFKCSPQINIKEKWEYIYDIFGFLGIGIILSILLVGLIIKNEWQFEADDYMFWIVVPLLNAFFLCLGSYKLIRRLRKKYYDEIHISHNDIEVVYEDGSIRKFCIEDIKKNRLESALSVGKIVFKDGTVLRDVERVSYWPVLQEKLLSTILH